MSHCWFLVLNRELVLMSCLHVQPVSIIRELGCSYVSGDDTPGTRTQGDVGQLLCTY